MPGLTLGRQEIEALEELSEALVTLLKSEAWNYVKGEVIKRTIFAALMSSLAPLALLKIGRIVGEYIVTHSRDLLTNPLGQITRG